MEWYDDSKACLAIAKQLIVEIDAMTEETAKQEFLIPYMKVKIKNSLENCRSPLDYVAQFIFNEYCRSEYLDSEQKKPIKKRKINPYIYYPISKTSEGLRQSINKKYFPLKNNYPEIVKIFNNGQLFSNPENPYLHHLNVLTNENKHRNLTSHKKLIHANIKYGKIGGATFVNTEITTSSFTLGGHELNLFNASNSSLDLDADLSLEYFFEELNLSVLPTLNNIFEGVSRIIESLYIETCKAKN